MKARLLFLLLLVLSSVVYAQKKSGTSNSGIAASANSLAIGLRLGDPTGVTIKKYLAKKRAFELNIGQSSDWGYDYRDEFYQYDQYKEYEYVGFKKGSAIAIQAHYLLHDNFPDVTNLQWYWGIGAQARFKTYQYDYRYRRYYGTGGGDYNWVYDREKVTNLDFGADGILGLEYRIKNSRLSLFADVNILLEIYDDPFNFYGQGGIGVRYSLK